MVFRINLAIRCNIFFIKFYFDLLNLHTFFFELIHDFYILCCHAFFSLCDHCLISDLYLIRHAKIFIRSCFLSFFRTHCWNRTIFQCKWCYDLITSSTWIKCDLTLRCNVFPTRYNRYGSWYDLDPFCLKFILNLQISHKSSRIWIGDHCLISYMISFFIKLYWS